MPPQHACETLARNRKPCRRRWFVGPLWKIPPNRHAYGVTCACPCRRQVDKEQGFETGRAVARLRQQTWVTPLGRYPKLPQTIVRTIGDRNIAPFTEGVAEELRFWEQLRAWMALFPPPDADRLLVRSFCPLGLLGGPDTYVHADADLVASSR